MPKRWMMGLGSVVAVSGLLVLAASAPSPAADAIKEAPKAAPTTTPAATPTSAARTGPVKTQIAPAGNGWTLVRDGKPFFIMGAGGDASKPKLVEAGGNSYRTWGPPDIKQLDEAEKLGLAVTVGLWIGGDGGFNYSNSAAVAKQLEDCKNVINRLKDHPAVLMWGIGNEMEGPGKPGDNPALWKAIDDIAAAAKKLDPNHPTMTVVADVSSIKVKAIHAYCPHLDAVGINTYGEAALAVASRYRGCGGTKPYVVTEYGPPGVWSQIRTPPLGAPKVEGPAPYQPIKELTSTEKAKYYRDGWKMGVLGARGLCLGGYAFTWGNKWEATATWYGMFLADGAKVEAVDAMTEMWTGKPPANCCPRIREFKLVADAGPNAKLFSAGEHVGARVSAMDPENDPLTYKWSLNADGEGQKKAFPDAIKRAENGVAEIELPAEGGNLRLYVYVYDGKGGAATASLPLKAIGPAAKP
jgi:hypothetical protein